MKLPRLTRRRFLGLTAAGLGLYAWRFEPHWLEVVERDLPIAKLPAALEGCKLAQLSDLHVGRVDLDYLRATLETVSALRPDMTVVTGDFMTCDGTERVEEVLQLMRHLQPGPFGCYAILGNHDYAMSWSRDDVSDRMVRRLAELGIRFLRNECVTVSGLQLVGVDDLWGPNFGASAVVPQVDWNEPTLTLCHNPDAVDLPSMAAVRGWILAGHTHGGQCKPPFLPPPLLPVQNRRYTSGEFDIGPGRRLYINRGVGYLMRVRFNARPEVTIFRLCPA